MKMINSDGEDKYEKWKVDENRNEKMTILMLMMIMMILTRITMFTSNPKNNRPGERSVGKVEAIVFELRWGVVLKSGLKSSS